MKSLLMGYAVPTTLCWVGGLIMGITFHGQYYIAGSLVGGALVMLGYATQLITIDTDFG
jgi:hypothetical protein